MSPWKTYLAVGLGSGLGSVLRYAVSLISQAVLGSYFPWGTLIVNVIGSGLISWIATTALRAPHGKLAHRHPFLVAGFCGGFTTFSVFSLETLHFITLGQAWLGLLYVMVSLPLWLLVAMAGERLASRNPLPH
ncbi:fluoride efflux transporter FluC [Vreelandella populi]|uniref:Fluoride-specific ion channel FluC n=1 Tax=Vreelandella populi TaxID=2498858 RepID=A0A3S0WPV7_9GAMM|nr:CrcB family protein [Halomonas populi]RUR37801.1 CrcB family protein [Halomonas populi]RUR48710.1 CrcB family protein [Halomonas populi]